MLYNKFGDFLKLKYGERVRKLTLNIGADCPNRDGNISRLGCFFCDYTKSGFDAPDPTVPLRNQVEEGIKYYRSKKINKLIGYFQVGTNTYYDLDKLERYIDVVLEYPEIVSISISTRPDCIDEEVLELFSKVKRKTDLIVEIGVQTVNYKTLLKINRGHTLSETIRAAILLKNSDIFTVAHIIIGLPGDDRIDIIETARIINALNIDAVKLHSLYVPNESVFGKMYKRGRFNIIDLDTYVDYAVDFIISLDPRIIIERLVSKPPRNGTLFSNWGVSWKKIINMIEIRMKENDLYQGKNYKKFSIRKVDEK